MPQDHEDGTVPTIITRADMTLCVDITAQTIGNIGIDIKAQTLGQLNINIAASAVKLAITINAADITGQIPIDIKTQTLGQVNINIKAQTLGQLNVNIAASAATVTVSVTGTANISITAQSVGVSVQGEWQVGQGNQKQFYGFIDAVAPDGIATTVIDYTVPTGKTLCCYSLSCFVYADAVADRDLNQMGAAYLKVDSTVLLVVGGNGGGVLSFGAPMKFTQGQRVISAVFNASNHTCDMNSTIIGYEV